MPVGRSSAACSGVSGKSRVRAGAGSSGIAAAIERRSWWRAAHSSHAATRARGALEVGARRVARGVRGDQLEVVVGVLAVGQVGHLGSLTAAAPDRFPWLRARVRGDARRGGPRPARRRRTRGGVRARAAGPVPALSLATDWAATDSSAADGRLGRRPRPCLERRVARRRGELAGRVGAGRRGRIGGPCARPRRRPGASGAALAAALGRRHSGLGGASSVTAVSGWRRGRATARGQAAAGCDEDADDAERGEPRADRGGEREPWARQRRRGGRGCPSGGALLPARA